MTVKRDLSSRVRDGAPGGWHCVSCGTHNRAGAYCFACGEHHRPGAVRTPGSVKSFFAAVRAERSGLLAAIVVFACALALSYALWVPASLPARVIDAPIPETNCVGEVPGTTAMHACAARVAGLTMVGPIVLTVLVVVFRKQVAAALERATPALPAGSEILVAPLLATAFFLLSWAGIHASTGWQTGILPQKMFPAVVGLFTFGSGWYGPAVGRRLAGYYNARDRVPSVLRLAATIAIPIAVSVWVTNQDRVTDTALKEQAVVLLGLALAYFLMVPRGGDIVAGVRQMLPPAARRGSGP